MMRDAETRKSLGKSFLRIKARTLFAVIGLGFLVALFAVVATGKPVTHRPPIIGIAHIALKTDNLAAARELYGQTLGFQEPFTVDKPTGGRLLKHARYYWLLLAESHLTRRLFGAMLRRIELLPLPAG